MDHNITSGSDVYSSIAGHSRVINSTIIIRSIKKKLFSYLYRKKGLFFQLNSQKNSCHAILSDFKPVLSNYICVLMGFCRNSQLMCFSQSAVHYAHFKKVIVLQTGRSTTFFMLIVGRNTKSYSATKYKYKYKNVYIYNRNV